MLKSLSSTVLSHWGSLSAGPSIRTSGGSRSASALIFAHKVVSPQNWGVVSAFATAAKIAPGVARHAGCAGRRVPRSVSCIRTTASFTGPLNHRALLCRASFPRGAAFVMRFLFVGSQLCLKLPSDPASRRRPCSRSAIPLWSTRRGLPPHQLVPIPGVHDCLDHRRRDAQSARLFSVWVEGLVGCPVHLPWIMSEKARGVRMGTDLNFLRTSRSLSPVTMQSTRAANASPRTGMSSGSRHTLDGNCVGTSTWALSRRSAMISRAAFVGSLTFLTRFF